MTELELMHEIDRANQIFWNSCELFVLNLFAFSVFIELESKLVLIPLVLLGCLVLSAVIYHFYGGYLEETLTNLRRERIRALRP